MCMRYYSIDDPLLWIENLIFASMVFVVYSKLVFKIQSLTLTEPLKSNPIVVENFVPHILLIEKLVKTVEKHRKTSQEGNNLGAWRLVFSGYLPFEFTL